MQFLRDLTWRLIGIATLSAFTIVLLLSNLLTGQFWEVPRFSVSVVYLGLFLGLINKLTIFQLGDTLAHEIGHAQSAALTLGKVMSIRVERDTSGVTFHRQSFLFRRLSSALISMSGPLSSSVVFVITARLVASELTAYWAMGVGIFIALILLTTVRNIWGWLTGLTIIGFLYLILEASGFITPRFLSEQDLVTSNNFLVIGVLWIVSVNAGSALQYSLRSRVAKNPNSDEFKFSKALFLPPIIGGHMILLIQVILIWVGLGFLLGWNGIFQIGRLI